MKIVLASASPRRRELLRLITPDFIVKESAVDETTAAEEPEEIVKELAYKKAAAVAERQKDALVIGADTIVYLAGEILGKPEDEADAARMIRLLSGKTHFVYTGLCVMEPARRLIVQDAEKTAVTFAELSEKEIREYIAAGEYADKAGAYGIQGSAAKLITGIHGCYYNVMGLPVRRLYEILQNWHVC